MLISHLVPFDDSVFGQSQECRSNRYPDLEAPKVHKAHDLGVFQVRSLKNAAYPDTKLRGMSQAPVEKSEGSFQSFMLDSRGQKYNLYHYVQAVPLIVISIHHSEFFFRRKNNHLILTFTCYRQKCL